jgi:uracil-DNA glycosylase family 4
VSAPDSENGDEVFKRKHPLAKCEECPYRNEGGFVPTLNPHPSSGIIVLGEAPGAYESVRGIPFTGPSGDLLNQVLNHHGLFRDNIMITNSVLCRPEADADPPKAARDACAPRLHAEIDASNADTIVAVGKVAAHSVLDERGSMRRMRVGPPKPYVRNKNVRVIPTWHPAYSLRSPDSFPDLVFDFGKIKDEKIHDWHEPIYRVFDDPGAAIGVLNELRTRFDRIVIDIECGVEKDEAFVHPSEYDLLCVGIAFAPNRAVVIGENALADESVRSALRHLLSSTRIIAHNGKFDLAGLRTVAGKQQLWFDTMLAAYALDERPGHMGLKVLSIERLGAPDYESEIKQYVPRGGSYANIPRQILYRYNAYDVVCTWALYELFSGEFSDDDRRKHDFTVSAANTLIELELAGIGFDLEYNEKLAHEYEVKIGDIETRIADLIGYDLNPRSPQQVTNYYARHAITLPSTNADLLKELRAQLSGEVLTFTDLLLEHRREAKLYGTYVKGLAKRVTTEGKVYTTYLLHGTTSGRLASREPNLQNVVRNKPIRNQFVVLSEDHRFIQLDYKQAEGRVITTLARDEYLREIFADPNRDLFSELCNDIFGVGNWGKENRVAMKSIFYGNAYGRGAASIARELQLQNPPVNITVEEAATLMRNFNNLIPDVKKWQASIKHQVLSGHDLKTPYGRKRSFWLITDKNQADVLNEALSFLPQSIASDICLTALIRLQPMLAGLATVRLTIHDAIVVECHQRHVEETIDLMRTEMVRAAEEFTTYVPFEVDATIASRLGEL